MPQHGNICRGPQQNKSQVMAGQGQKWELRRIASIAYYYLLLIKARLQPRLESYKLYTQGHQRGKQSSKEKESK